MNNIELITWGLPLLAATIVSHVKNDIPKRVLRAFDKQYKLVIGLEWSARHPLYIANFIAEGKRCYARFNEKGQLVEQGSQILESQIEQSLLDEFFCWVPFRKITDYFLVNRNIGSKAYLCRGKTGDTLFEALFSEDGELIRHERYKITSL